MHCSTEEGANMEFSSHRLVSCPRQRKMRKMCWHLQVVGRGYYEDAQVANLKPTTYAAKNKERRRPSKSEYSSLSNNISCETASHRMRNTFHSRLKVTENIPENSCHSPNFFFFFVVVSIFHGEKKVEKQMWLCDFVPLVKRFLSVEAKTAKQVGEPETRQQKKTDKDFCCLAKRIDDLLFGLIQLRSARTYVLSFLGILCGRIGTLRYVALKLHWIDYSSRFTAKQAAIFSVMYTPV